MNIAGKRALVTGSGSGLGDAIAVGLAAEGVAVVVHGRDRDRTEAVAERIVAMGGSASVAIGVGLLDEILGLLPRAAQPPRRAEEPIEVIAKRLAIEAGGLGACALVVRGFR